MIRGLENDKLYLEETVQTLKESSSTSNLQKEGKQFSIDMRLFVYDSIVNHVPTKNVPILIENMPNGPGLMWTVCHTEVRWR